MKTSLSNPEGFSPRPKGEPGRAGSVQETEVLIIGGGVTGCGLMRDLALRGIHCLLIDQKDLNAGASGGNHGLLHSGGRYVAGDAETAAECRIEGDILKRLAPQCIEDSGGLFVAVEGDDPVYAERFPELCAAAGIPCETLTPAQARALEPALSERLFAAYALPDATIDPFRVTLENVSAAQTLNGSQYLPHTQIIGFERDGDRLTAALCRNNRSGETLRIRAAQFVNAAGAWSMRVAQLAGCDDVPLFYSKGTLGITNTRITNRVINRLRPPGDGDILVPGGTVSLLGTTSDRVDDPDGVRPTVEEIDRNVTQGAAMVPALAHARFMRAFSGVRPLVQSGGADADGRGITRGLALIDHSSQALANLATITGGKLTTYRLMAEKAGDLVAARLGNEKPCRTAEVPLEASSACQWTEPGHAPRYWSDRNNAADMILCECEMVPQSAVDEIVALAPGHEDEMTLQAISLRSRAGKGPCQGSFCSIRIASYLYDCDVYQSRAGLSHIREFVEERFRGLRPVLWGEQMAQMELAEALHCGLMGLDLLANAGAEASEPSVVAKSARSVELGEDAGTQEEQHA